MTIILYDKVILYNAYKSDCGMFTIMIESLKKQENISQIRFAGAGHHTGGRVPG